MQFLIFVGVIVMICCGASLIIVVDILREIRDELRKANREGK